ncbi:MAG: nitroreductase family deazaflavin-dependent oxidoreductase [Acidimicrobiia bacterium]|nr:nitroreductase family deazaflavin-dependent oxidoreductase [Acidimicrobiia bacterium]
MSANYLRPGRFVQRLANPVVAKLGLATTLVTRGRATGERRAVPVNVLDLDGERYLVSVRGEADWVRNLRASGSGELQRGRRTETIRVAEVADEDRPPVIAAYRARWDRQVRKLFEALPHPSDHPVFRIEREPA